MRSIARILPVFVFVGRVALASPILVGRDSLVVCTYETAEGATGNITQRDLSAFLAGEETDIPKAALADCCAKTNADSSGERGDSLRADAHRDETTPPPAPSSMRDGAGAGESSNNDVQLDESTDNNPSGLSPPSEDVNPQDEDVEEEADPSKSSLRSSSNSQNAGVKAADKTNPSESEDEDVDGEMGSSKSSLRSSSKSPLRSSSKSPLRSSSNSQNADIEADDKTNPSESEDVDGEMDSSKSSLRSSSKSPLRSSSNSQNAGVKAADKTNPSESEDVDGEMGSSKSPLPSSNTQNAGIKAADKMNSESGDVNGEMDSSKSPFRSSGNSQNADVKAADETNPSESGDVNGEMDSSKSSFRSSGNSQNADSEADDKMEPSETEDVGGEADLLDDAASELAGGANQAQVKGKAVNKAPAAGDSGRARVGTEDCPCRK